MIMNLFKQITTYFSTVETEQRKKQPSVISSNSFEIITTEIIEDSLREEFIVLGLPSK